MWTTRDTTENTKAEKQTSRLLQLPAELRIVVYEMALLINSGAEAQAASYQELLDAPDVKYLELGKVRAPPLTRTCRQIEEEALPVFFRINDFAVTSCNGRMLRAHPRSRKWVAKMSQRIGSVELRADNFGSKARTVAILSIGQDAVELTAVTEDHRQYVHYAQDYLASYRRTQMEHKGDTEVDFAFIQRLACIYLLGPQSIRNLPSRDDNIVKPLYRVSG
jgi:hypothetical protein